MENLKTGLIQTFESRRSRVIGIVIFIVALIFYLMTLPASYTGGRIGPAALRFLNAELVIFSTLLAFLIGLLLPMAVYLYRQGQRSAKASTAGGVLVGVLAPVLCCSPLLPIAFSFLAGVFPSLIGASAWRIQGFIATHQTQLFSVAVVLLVFAVYFNARAIARGPRCALVDTADTHRRS